MLSNEEMDKQAEEALEESRKERERQEEEIRLLQEKRVSFPPMTSKLHTKTH